MSTILARVTKTVFDQVASRIKRWKALTVVSLVSFPLTILWLVCVAMAPVKEIEDKSLKDKLPKVETARDEALERSIYYEQLVVAIGTIELGILAYIAGITLGKDSEIKRPRLFYFLAIVLLSATTGAYLHAWKMYMSYGAYILKLEHLMPERELRTIAQTFAMARAPNVEAYGGVLGAFLRFLANAYNTMFLVAFYPVFLMAAAVIAFGRRVEVSWDLISALLVLVFCGAIIYVSPDVLQFFRLVQLVTNGG